MSNRQERKARKAANQQLRFNKEFAERGIETVYTPTPEPDYSGLERRMLAAIWWDEAVRGLRLLRGPTTGRRTK